MSKSGRWHVVALLGLLFSLSISPVTADDAQDGTRVGMTASVQDDQLDVLVPIWLSPRFVLTPAVGAAIVGDAAKNYDLGLIVRGNLKEGDAVPYLGFRFGALIQKPEGGESMMDVILGPLFGGECFLNEHFSVGVEAQLNIAVSDNKSYRFGNPDKTNVNTATAVFATFYF